MANDSSGDRGSPPQLRDIPILRLDGNPEPIGVPATAGGIMVSAADVAHVTDRLVAAETTASHAVATASASGAAAQAHMARADAEVRLARGQTELIATQATSESESLVVWWPW